MQLPGQQGPSRFDRFPVGLVSSVSILVLGALAAVVLVFLVPELLTIESSCVSAQGWTRSDGDQYFGTVLVLGTFGWLGVAVATIYASIAERRLAVLLLPYAWFVAFMTLALTIAVIVSPAPCAG